MVNRILDILIWLALFIGGTAIGIIIATIINIHSVVKHDDDIKELKHEINICKEEKNYYIDMYNNTYEILVKEGLVGE